MGDPGQPNRRKHRRVSFVKDVVLEGVGPARSSDISAGGMYIETMSGFRVGADVVLQFKLNHTDRDVIKSHALVRYVHEGVGMGLAFTDLSPDDRDKIDRLVNQLS
jgi:c-di-GMP-binding flagellar brake protein YcgR